MLLLAYLKELRKGHRGFFIFVCSVLFLYFLQFLIKTEISPIGYFSLYSNYTPVQESYKQILPEKNSVPVNIYAVRGTGFLMFEILPTRYQILSNADHCNQMNHKLSRIGLHDNNETDCERLKDFMPWFTKYAERMGVAPDSSGGLYEYGFLNGEIKGREAVR